MNKELLFQLYCIHSKSGNEKKMRKFLRKQAFDCGATSVETDKKGNLLIIKGESETYPCLAAHMDQVQNKHSKDFRVIEIGEDVIGWSPKCHEQQGLGADDKNGIFICLELLRKFDVMKVAFFVGEETGCVGSSEVDLSFFKDCRFIIQPDRMGRNDLITSMFVGSVCSKDFINAIGYADYGYSFERGSITDVGELVERGVGISCLNLSCGYYDAHTDHEMTVLSHLENCLNFVEHIVATCTDVYPYVYEYDYDYGCYRGYGKHGYYDDFYGYGHGYGYYGGKKYDSAKEKTTKQPTACKTLVSSETYDVDEDEYYNGYEAEDRALMLDYLTIQPDLTFEEIKSMYLHDFHANFYLDADTCECTLYDMYKEAKDAMENYWDEDDYYSDGYDDLSDKSLDEYDLSGIHINRKVS